VIVSELTAKKFFNGRNPLGMRLFFKTNLRDERPFTVVGVAADTRALGMDVPMRPFVYFPFDQVPQFNIGIVVRAPKVGSASLGAMREAIAAVDPTQPLYATAPLQHLAWLAPFHAAALVVIRRGRARPRRARHLRHHVLFRRATHPGDRCPYGDGRR
jgi:hypothetical protein